jgi:hypothetical protein
MVDDYESVYRRLIDAKASAVSGVPTVTDLNGRAVTAGSTA